MSGAFASRCYLLFAPSPLHPPHVPFSGDARQANCMDADPQRSECKSTHIRRCRSCLRWTVTQSLAAKRRRAEGDGSLLVHAKRCVELYVLFRPHVAEPQSRRRAADLGPNRPKQRHTSTTCTTATTGCPLLSRYRLERVMACILELCELALLGSGWIWRSLLGLT